MVGISLTVRLIIGGARNEFLNYHKGQYHTYDTEGICDGATQSSPISRQSHLGESLLRRTQ